MKMSKSLLVLLAAFIITQPAFSKTEQGNIQWECLKLTPEQQKGIIQLEEQWYKTRQTVIPQLMKDQEKLKLILANPDLSEKQLRTIQESIILKQDQLRKAAIDDFIAKRKVLNHEQKVDFHKMLTGKYPGCKRIEKKK